MFAVVAPKHTPSNQSSQRSGPFSASDCNADSQHYIILAFVLFAKVSRSKDPNERQNIQTC